MIYIFGDCELDTCLYSVQRSGQIIQLRPKVFRVCLYLLQHRDRVVSPKELCAQVWSGQFISQRTLEGVIRAVRQAVGDSGQAQGVIQTLYGYGYRFVAAVEERPIRATERGVPATADVPIAEGALAFGQPVGGTGSVASGSDTERPKRAAWLGEWHRGKAFEDGYRAVSSAGYIPGGQHSARPHGDRGPPMNRVVQALALLILSFLGGWGLWQRMAVGDSLDKSCIAVLPFISLSAGEDRAHVADGMTEALIAELSQIPGLTVIPHTLVMKYKGTREGVATIGRELQVGTILEGSVRSVDNQLRINAQLIDVVSEGYVWSAEYDRELTGVFAIESDIATEVAQQVKVRLAASREQQMREK
jgi:TolB-like protein/DNA-binding winged helix-turn-helix (wHTH) protein